MCVVECYHRANVFLCVVHNSGTIEWPLFVTLRLFLCVCATEPLQMREIIVANKRETEIVENLNVSNPQNHSAMMKVFLNLIRSETNQLMKTNSPIANQPACKR